MGQGEANITSRSDVRLGIESGPGTSGQRLQAVVNAVTTKLAAVRQCYADVTSERPTVQGEMRLTLRLPPRGRVQLDTTQDTSNDAPLARCIRREIEAANYRDCERPAQVTIALTFTNTAARGIEQMEQRSAGEARVDVRRDQEGRFFATGGTPGREVTFTVTGDAAATQENVAAMQRSLRAAIAGLLDCRRRAARHEMNSEGDLEFRVQAQRSGRARFTSVSTTVQDERAPTCVSRTLTRARFEPAAAGNHRLVVHFAGARALDVPTRP